MGNFFTSSQIYNDKGLNKQQFIDKFCKAMSDSGYEVCDSDDSEKSYILRFATNSKWVAIASEEYGQNGRAAQSEAGRIAKMLGTYCMNTEVIDSDCAAMSLYGKDGKSADMLLMGRYDDYFGDDTPEPNKKIWTQLLSDGSTWEQFTKTLSGEYVFVEDGLAQLAPVIGMDSGNLLFSVEDDVDDESAVFLDFKKAGTKKEKKLTLNAAFKQVFGEALEPLGFKKVKSKYPYYVRVINNEIVQVISFYNEKDGDYQTYTVVGGIATPYRKKIDFSVRPSCHMEWLGSNSKYYFFSDPSDYSYEYDGYLHEVYLSQTADSNKLLTAMKQSFEDVKKWMLPVFNDITTIDDTIIFYLNYHSDCFGLRKEIFDQGLYTQDNEILLLSQIQNENLVIEKYIQKLKQHNEFEAKIGRAACQINIEKAKEKLIDSIQYLKYNKKYLALANEYKIRNTEILKNMFVEDGLAQLAPVIGMDSGNLLFSAEDDINDESAVFLDFKKAGTKKEKKLTLNTAFKQIFGDGLKVQGFQVVKGRYPYLVRVINDEILHVISIRPRQAEYPEDKAFSILGGIATVYRRSIDLNANPMENYHWLRNNVTSFYLYSIDTEPDRRLASIMSQFNYFSEVPKSLPCVMKEALEYTKKYMISYMDGIDSLEKCINHLIKAKLISTAPLNSGLQFTSGTSYDDGLIYLKTNYKHHKELWEDIIEKKEDISDEQYNRIKEFYKFFTDDEYIQGLANELERRKQKNLLALENIGIDI